MRRGNNNVTLKRIAKILRTENCFAVQNILDSKVASHGLGDGSLKLSPPHLRALILQSGIEWAAKRGTL